MSYKDIDSLIAQIVTGTTPSDDPLSALNQAHPHITDVPKIAVIDSSVGLGLVLSHYEKKGIISVYVPNGENSSAVSPVQLLLVNLVDYAARRLHGTTTPEGISLDKAASDIFETLLELDPGQSPHLNRMRERNSIKDYAHNVSTSYSDVNNLSRNFRSFVDDFIKKAEGEHRGAREVILAGIPSFSPSQEKFVRDYGLYHHNLIYAVSR